MFRRRRHMTVASSVSILLILGGLVGCSNGQPAGYAHFDPGSHTIMINGSHYPLKLPGRADLKVDGSAVLPADLGVDAAVRGSDASRDGIYRSEDGNEQFYYVLTDRFANGDEKNDTGGYGATAQESGFDPTNENFYLGGDIPGLIEQLDYIKGLGTTALWISSPLKNKPVQGESGSESGAYLGRWITDFTDIDPHLGTKDDFQELVDQAHERGMKVYIDVVANNTADVISYAEKDTPFVPLADKPYRDLDGNRVNLGKVAGKEEFPEIDPSSFPYTPQAGNLKKVPAWLNDTSLYHNRGDSTLVGPSLTLGDIGGLDDLMTENPEVVRGMEEIYQNLLETGIDGFGISDVTRVNQEFWTHWTQAIKRKAGDDFFMFGEVTDPDVGILSSYVHTTDMDAVLDSGFHKAVIDYVNGGSAQGLADLFYQDPRYASDKTTVLDLPTYLGNPDMARIVSELSGDKVSGSIFAHALMFTMRGQPVIYYGDEQGLVGLTGSTAHQPLFATQVPSYQQQALADGSTFGAGAHMSRDTVLYQAIAELARLRKKYPGLSNGSQIELFNEGTTYAFSRVDPEENIEYVVVANSGEQNTRATIPVLASTQNWSAIMNVTDGKVIDGSASSKPQATTTNGVTDLSVDVPARSVTVFRAGEKLERGSGTTALTGKKIGDSFLELTADTQDHRYANTAFFYRVVGSGKWFPLGSIAGPDPRVYHDLSGIEDGTLLEYRAITDGGRGQSYTYLVGGPEIQMKNQSQQ
ncbi:hypothetical protein JTE88_06490 [Arcanobacterium phocisimile]|uniref:Glycosyl hydrolase family 13 catalytic domain-containing protein n=1 Tax=Arcanobacterium phocisimile TaxID=1302235 RepID=A0ABX7IH01_9ACTO|nr:alpha-amylase family glycosyl hydrolase [Arcanobacterium phocisimile]QRV01739.1 hypothetical protein JTE88_06490 [Arcanobacterium phocisimile]